jgi:hypothetical protein
MEPISNNYARSYYEMFILSLLLVFSPAKVLAFVIPFIALFWFIVRSKSGASFKRFVLINFAWVLLLFFYSWYSQQIGLDFIAANASLSYLNYASIFLILVIPAAIISPTYNYEKYARFLLYVILIEGSIGIVQRILGAVFRPFAKGDVVEGTINPLSFFFGHSGFGNQFFAINMVFLLIFCFPFVYGKKRIWIAFFMIGFLALVLASVGHVFYSFLLAVVVTYLIFEGWTLLLKIKMLIMLVGIVSAMLLTLAKLDPGVFNASQRQFEVFLNGETPKAQAATVAFTQLARQYPTIHLVGIGPAQYSSRAGTIASGTYYNLSVYFANLPVLKMGMTAPFKKYVLSTWLKVQTNLDTYGNSTMYRPFFSWLSIYVEFGGLTWLLLFLIIINQIRVLKIKYHSLERAPGNQTIKLMALSCCAAILFLFFIGLYENYYETSQGIFIGILLILLMRAHFGSHWRIHQPMAGASVVKKELVTK